MKQNWIFFFLLLVQNIQTPLCFFRFHLKSLWRPWSWWSIDTEPRISKQAEIQAYWHREPSTSRRSTPCTVDIMPGRTQRKLSMVKMVLWPMVIDHELPKVRKLAKNQLMLLLNSFSVDATFGLSTLINESDIWNGKRFVWATFLLL